jgi:hypothetical protein
MSQNVVKGKNELETRQKEAKERQVEYNKLKTQQKINILDKRLGKSVGAIKERARLLKKLEAPKQVPIIPIEIKVEKVKKIKHDKKRKSNENKESTN